MYKWKARKIRKNRKSRKIRKIRNLRNLRKPPEKARQGRSGKSGILRKIPSASSPARKYMLFTPKPQALRRFICPATAHLRTKCRTPLRCGPQNTPAPRRKSVPLRFPPEQAEGRSGKSGTSGTGPQGPLRPRRTPSGSPRAQHIHHLQSHILHFKALYTYFNYKQ